MLLLTDILVCMKNVVVPVRMRWSFVGSLCYHSYVMEIAETIFVHCECCFPSKSVAQRGCTPLIWAAEKGHADCVRVLLDVDVDKNAKNKVRRVGSPRATDGE